MTSDNSIDLIILNFYLIFISSVGLLIKGNQKSIRDYFLGSEKISWFAVGFSIIAAETSSLTFISIPGLAFKSNLNFIQLVFRFFIGRILVAFLLLPNYYQGKISTVYTFLENRFGKKIRNFASIIFLVTRVAADGVRLFAAAIPI